MYFGTKNQMLQCLTLRHLPGVESESPYLASVLQMRHLLPQEGIERSWPAVQGQHLCLNEMLKN